MSCLLGLAGQGPAGTRLMRLKEEPLWVAQRRLVSQLQKLALLVPGKCVGWRTDVYQTPSEEVAQTARDAQAREAGDSSYKDSTRSHKGVLSLKNRNSYKKVGIGFCRLHAIWPGSHAQQEPVLKRPSLGRAWGLSSLSPQEKSMFPLGLRFQLHIMLVQRIRNKSRCTRDTKDNKKRLWGSEWSIRREKVKEIKGKIWKERKRPYRYAGVTRAFFTFSSTDICILTEHSKD